MSICVNYANFCVNSKLHQLFCRFDQICVNYTNFCINYANFCVNYVNFCVNYAIFLNHTNLSVNWVYADMSVNYAKNCLIRLGPADTATCTRSQIECQICNSKMHKARVVYIVEHWSERGLHCLAPLFYNIYYCNTTSASIKNCRTQVS
jgi:hypothetical protein